MTEQSQKPLVSVYMPTHNRIHLLPRAVNSVLRQDHENLELIIVNDASKDATKSWLDELAQREDRVKIIHLPESKGPSHARNLAIKQAKGEFVTGLDDDDEFLPNRLSVFLRNWDKDYAFVTSSLLWDYGDSRKVLGGKPVDITLSDLLSHKHEPCHVFTQTQRFIDSGLFDENMRNSEDWDMWIRLGLTKLPMKQTSEATYIVHTSHDSPRLSLDNRKADGMRRLIAKYRDIMSSKNRKDMAVRLAITEERSIPLTGLISLLTKDNALLYSKFWLRKNLPAVVQFLQKLRSR